MELKRIVLSLKRNSFTLLSVWLLSLVVTSLLPGHFVFSSTQNSVEECVSSLKKEGSIRFTEKFPIINSANVLEIDTHKCKGIPLTISFKGSSVWNYRLRKSEEIPENGCWVKKDNSTVTFQLKGEPKKDREELTITPIENKASIYLRTDEDSCYGSPWPDCQIYTVINVGGKKGEKVDTFFAIKDALSRLYEKKDRYNCYASDAADYYKDKDKNRIRVEAFDKGAILAECDGACGGTDWRVLGISGASHSYGSSVKDVVEVNNYATYDTKSKCYRPELNDGMGGYLPNCYEFLAPIDFDVNGGNLKGVQSKDGHTWIENIRKFRFGDYINFLFRIAISALVIISVVMIMVAGIEYMTVESIFGRSQAKARIKNAIGGLILALASYTILYTINPNLVDIGALDNMETVIVGDGGGETGVGNLNAGGSSNGNTSSTTASGGGAIRTSSTKDDPRNLDPEWAREHAPVLKFKDKNGNNYDVRACDTSNYVSYRAFGKNVYTHKGLKKIIQRISQKWKDKGGNNFYKIRWIGGYSCRTIGRPGQPNDDVVSTHAYGVTIDINPEQNPYRSHKPSGGWGSRDTYTDMPKEFVKLFTDEGFGWGGDWNSKKDAMHFTKYGKEGGDQTFEF